MKIFKRKKTVETDHQEEERGIIGEYEEDGLPVILRFVHEIPDSSIFSRLPWFTVISWKYDGKERNGMPTKATNLKMLELQKALDSKFIDNRICRHAYNRTGNGLKEFNYYISDKDKFMEQFNDALAGHEVYPIDISFYEDPEWTEWNKLLENFKLKR